MPCKRMEIKTKLLNKLALKGNTFSAGLDLIFDTSVQVSESLQVTYWYDLLYSIGGLLGLFLGVSLMQMWDLASKGWGIITNFLQKILDPLKDTDAGFFKN